MLRILSVLTIFLAIICVVAGSVYAETTPAPQSQINLSDVQKLIDDKLGEQKPLSQEELTESLLDMKDQRIANLQSDFSNAITAVGVIIAVATICAVIIAWILKKGVDDKLKVIVSKEAAIEKIQRDMQSKYDDFNEFYKEVQQFKRDHETFKTALAQKEEDDENRSKGIKSLYERYKAVEEVLDGHALIFDFLQQSSRTPQIIAEVGETLNKPQKNLNHVLMRLSEKMSKFKNYEIIFKDMEDVEENYEYYVGAILKEEQDFRKLLTTHVKVEDIYLLRPDDDQSSHFEDVEGFYNEWKGYLDSLRLMESVWGDHLEMNPPDNKQPEVES